QAVDREDRAVAAGGGARPGVGRHAVVTVGQGGRRLAEGGRHRGRVLLAVAALDGGHVLVPVGEAGGVLGQHERQAGVEDPVDVLDVAGGGGGRPPGRPRGG